MKKQLNFTLDKQDVSNFPMFIKQEYMVLYQMIEGKEYYGALLQSKDLLEMCLKFPQIIILAGMEQYIMQEHIDPLTLGNKYNRALKIFERILNSALSFGHWEETCGLFSKLKIDDLPIKESAKGILIEFLNVLKAEYACYMNPEPLKKSKGDYRISSWRNDTIGHGACNTNIEEVKILVEKLLMTLNAIISLCDYSKVIFEQVNEKYIIRMREADEEIIINPFISGLTYLFESFYRKKNIASVLNYSSGIKQIDLELTDRFTLLCEKLNFNRPNENIASSKLVWKKDWETLKASISKDIVANIPFYKFVQKSLHGYDKGVFLIQAERGMGKTIFARSICDNSIDNLDCIETEYRDANYLNHNNEQLVVWSYHFNSIFSSSSVTFWQSVKRFFSRDIAFAEDLYTKEIAVDMALANHSANLKEAFSEYLEYISAISDADTKYLIVLDGLDEINTKCDNAFNIKNFVDPESLPHNFYFLLLARTDEEFLIDQDVNSVLTDKCKIFKNDSEYNTVLLNYITKFIGCSTEETKNLLEQTDFRFLELAAYKKIFDYDKNEFSNVLRRDDKLTIIEIFIDIISKVSKKYGNDLLKVLLILAIVKEPLTISELNYLYCYDVDKVSFKFLGMLWDLSSFLKIERNSIRGDLIYFSNEAFAEVFENPKFENEKSAILEAIKNYLKNILLRVNFQNEAVYTDSDNEILLTSVVIDDINLDKDDISNLLQLIYHNANDVNTYKLNRLIKICEYIDLQLLDEHKMFASYAFGLIMQNYGNFDKAIILYRRYLDLVENSNSKLSNERIDQFDNVRIRLLELCYRKSNLQMMGSLLGTGEDFKAGVLEYKTMQLYYFYDYLKEYDKAEVILKEMLADNDLPDIFRISFVFMLGYIYGRNGDHDSANTEFNRAIELLMSIDKEEFTELPIYYANVLGENMLKILAVTGDYDKLSQILDFMDDGFRLLEKNYKEGGVFFDYNYLAKFYWIKSNLYIRKRDFINSVKWIDEVILLLENLDKKGQCNNYELLGHSYNLKGYLIMEALGSNDTVIGISVGNIDEAKNYNQKAYEIYSKLYEENRLVDIIEFGIVCFWKAQLAYFSGGMKNYTDANNYCDKALALLKDEPINYEGRISIRATKIRMLKALCLEKLSKLNLAIKILESAIEDERNFISKLGKQIAYYDFTHLNYCYTVLYNLYVGMGSMKKAKAVYKQQAIYRDL